MYKMTRNYIFLLTVAFACIVKKCTCIEGAKALNVDSSKGFVAYLLNAKPKDKTDHIKHTDWLCGGAIISKDFILTSAACVADAKYMYAVAGTKQYKPLAQLKKINSAAATTTVCLTDILKKISVTCTPKGYTLDYANVNQWSNIDIALAKVDTPYDFGPNSKKCMAGYWRPTMIKPNYRRGYQDENISVLLYGWGHIKKWREATDGTTYNQDELRYTTTKIISKDECKQSYTHNGNLTDVIEKYMFCTNGTVQMNEEGMLLSGEEKENDGCDNQPPALRTECIEKQRLLRSRGSGEIILNTRRNGICQNDHGGPVTTYAGSQEIVIGVASLFRVDKNNECTGPFLHTSTYCNSKFISCILQHGSKQSRRAGGIVCHGVPPPEKGGFRVESRRISWMHHPDGPAADELEEDLIERPQIPIQSYL